MIYVYETNDSNYIFAVEPIDKNQIKENDFKLLTTIELDQITNEIQHCSKWNKNKKKFEIDEEKLKKYNYREETETKEKEIIQKE